MCRVKGFQSLLKPTDFSRGLLTTVPQRILQVIGILAGILLKVFVDVLAVNPHHAVVKVYEILAARYRVPEIPVGTQEVFKCVKIHCCHIFFLQI